MKILHTSDWHIGRTLYGHRRYAEFEALLDWLAGFIESEGVDVVLVAGDVFDNSTPSNHAQGLYYRFLCRVAALPQRQVVVTAGNHDSPSFLNAPRELLRSLNVHVVGSISDNPEDEIIVLKGRDYQPCLIVCAVPYLRDRDLRTAAPGESFEDKERKLIDGIRRHYRQVCALAEEKRAELETAVPIVALGHLFTAGGQTVEGDGVRELYVGSLAQVASDVFPACIDYLALGHLHVPQRVAGSEHLRYCGSPLPLGFGEAQQAKDVLLIEFSGVTPQVTHVPVPRFQELQTLRGDWPAIDAAIDALKTQGSTAWLEVVYEGEALAGNLRERLEEALEGSGLTLLRVKNRGVLEKALQGMEHEETLDDLDTTEVFRRCLEAHAIPQEQQGALMDAYREILLSLEEDDPRAD